MKPIKTPLLIISILFLICQVKLSSQNVGIGSSTPSAKLHLKSTVQSVTSLDLDFETGTIDPANTSGDHDWYITGTDGSNSAKSAKAPLMFSTSESAVLAYNFNMSVGKEITISFDYKYDDPTGLVTFSISSNGFSFVPPSNPDWKHYSTTFISQSTSNTLKIGVKALQDEAFPIVHVDNISITYDDGHVLKIEDGTEGDGLILQSDALGHTEWFDLRGEMDQKLSNNLQDLEFDTTQNALFIENGNGVLISALKNHNGKELKLSGLNLVGSPGMSLHLPNAGNENSSFHYDADNKTMDWGITNNFAKGAHSTRWGKNTKASNTYDTAWGEGTASNGGWSTSWGQANWALGVSSTSWGYTNTVDGQYGTAWGSNNFVTASLGTAWGDSNEATELLSTTFGKNNLSSGELSTSWGEENIASGLRSTVWGNSNQSTGDNSTSFGYNNLSSSTYATSWGQSNVASGLLSTSWGENNIALGTRSTAWGINNDANGSYSTAWGSENIASGLRSTAWGNGNVANSASSTSFGQNNHSLGQTATSWGQNNTASGSYSTSWGSGNTANSSGGTSWGTNNMSNADGATSWGYSNTVSRFEGTAWGSTNIVNGIRGTAWGLQNEIHTFSKDATACGYLNKTIGQYAFVSGVNNEIKSYAEVAFGRYNYSSSLGNYSDWIATDMLFSLGNGTSDTNRKNAISVLKNGNVGIGINSPFYDLHLQSDSAAKPGSSSWTVSSDRRLKKDISTFTDGLDIISAIEPVWFTYNGMADIQEGTYVGTIAQDLEEIAPYMVTDFTHHDKSGNSENYKAVNYGAMDFVLINAIKEQQAIIESQQETIDRQQVQIDEILSLIEKGKND